jgi:hypothetical protein
MSISITNFGFFAIPLTFLILTLRPKWLILWVIFLAPFQAASVLNVMVGNYPIGIQPGYFAALIFISYEIFTSLLFLRVYLSRLLIRIHFPLFLFAIYGVMITITAQIIWGGTLLVLPPRVGLNIERITPLVWSGTNFSQALYVVFLVIFCFFAALRILKDGTNGLMPVLRIFMITGIVVILIGIYQVIAWHTGLPFPVDTIFSNPSYQNTGAIQTIAGIKRLSAPFSEPSMAAYYLSAFYAFTLESYLINRRRFSSFFTVVLSIIALLLTTSTTAYLMLGIISGVAFFRHFLSRKKINKFIVLAGLFLAGLLIFQFFMNIDLERLVESTLLRKTYTTSFSERSSTDIHALKVLFQTYGLGSGLGSNRSSSLITSLLSTVGIWGVLLLASFLYKMIQLAKTATRSEDNLQFKIVTPFTFAVIAMVLSGIISVPDIIIITFWLNSSLLIGVSIIQISNNHTTNNLSTSPGTKRSPQIWSPEFVPSNEK